MMRLVNLLKHLEFTHNYCGNPLITVVVIPLVIIIVWEQKNSVTMTCFQLINLEVQYHSCCFSFFLSYVYVHNDLTHRLHLWHKFGQTRIAMGDFNNALHSCDKIGGGPISLREYFTSINFMLMSDLENYNLLVSSIFQTNHSKSAPTKWSWIYHCLGDAMWSYPCGDFLKVVPGLQQYFLENGGELPLSRIKYTLMYRFPIPIISAPGRDWHPPTWFFKFLTFISFFLF